MYTLCFIIEILLNMPAVVMKTHRAVNTGWTFDPALLDSLTVVMLCPLPTTYYTQLFTNLLATTKMLQLLLI